jgi:hypothetical protein
MEVPPSVLLFAVVAAAVSLQSPCLEDRSKYG